MKSFTLSSALLVLLVSGCQTASKKEMATPPEESSASPSSPTTSSAAVTTASGLKYRVMTSGPATGQSPTLSDTVVVHYHGILTDGTVFDSSYQRGEPATFGVGQVIAGWTEALQLMKPGDKWLLHIPAPLAYGSRAVGSKIPPNSDLIFQVELLQVMGGS
jgi:FKBP-type peptidyl-prolyl cis-trans isomerase FklB